VHSRCCVALGACRGLGQPGATGLAPLVRITQRKLLGGERHVAHALRELLGYG